MKLAEDAAKMQVNNLLSFLNFKNYCPACNSELSLRYINSISSSVSFKKIKKESNCLVIEDSINGYILSPQRKTTLNFITTINIFDNKYSVEFLDTLKRPLNFTSLELMKKYRKYFDGLYPYLLKECLSCKNYGSSICFEFKKDLITINPESEYLYLHDKDSDGNYNFYRIENNFLDKEAYFSKRKDKNYNGVTKKIGFPMGINGPLVDIPEKITNTKEYIDYINYMLTFA